LIFSSEKDGWNQKNFWRKASGYKYTFFLLKTDHGKIIGGYTTEEWKDQNW